VVHVLMDNGMRFFISATKNIAAGTEISLPFNFDYRKWYGQLFLFFFFYYYYTSHTHQLVVNFLWF